jgi:broad specificity phosphatase PhoE
VEILLVRHGETKWNRELVFRGIRDIPLSERGLRQAELLARRLKGEKIDAIFSSPLSRAMQTAQPAAQALALTVHPEEAINDLNFGLWAGLSVDQVKEKYPDQFEKWRVNPLEMDFPEGDSIIQARQRSFDWLKAASSADYARIALVTHKVILKLLVLSVLNAPERAYWQLQFSTCSVSMLTTKEGRFDISYLNDTHHYDEIGDDDLPDF